MSMLSAARVPAQQDERKSKRPERLSSAMPIQGVLLETIFCLKSKAYRALD